jgi:hypothetical protein
MAPKNLSKTKETTRLVMTTQQQEVQQNNGFAEQPTMQLTQEEHPAVQMLQNQVEEKMPLETAQMDSVEMAEKAYEEVHGRKSESKGTRWNIKRNVKRKNNRVSNLKKAENEFETEKQKMTPSQESVYKELENLDLSVLQVKNDEEFIEKYQQLSRAIYLAEQAKNWAGIVEGEKANQRMTKVAVTRKAIEKIRPFFEAKKQIMNNPYYVLLQGSDVKQMSSEEMQKRYEAAKQEGKQELAEFYKAVLHMESLKTQGNYLKEPEAAAEAARQEEKEWRSEVKLLRREYLVNSRLAKETDPTVIEELKARANLSLMAHQIYEKRESIEEKKKEMLKEKVPETKKFDGQRQWFAMINPNMSEDALISRYKKLASDNLDERTDEVIKVFEEFTKVDFSTFKVGSMEEVMENLEYNIWLANAGFQLEGLMEWVLAAGMKIPMELRQQVWEHYEFFNRVSKIYTGAVNVLQHAGYGTMTEAEMPKTMEDAIMLGNDGDQIDDIRHFASQIMVKMADADGLELDANTSIEEQWKNHKVLPMSKSFFTQEEREQKKKNEQNNQ